MVRSRVHYSDYLSRNLVKFRKGARQKAIKGVSNLIDNHNAKASIKEKEKWTCYKGRFQDSMGE